MEEVVVIVEIPKLKLRNCTSVQIKSPAEIYYLYSDDILKTLRDYNQKIEVLRSKVILDKFASKSLGYIIEKEREVFTYILCEKKIDAHRNAAELINLVSDLFKPLLRIFSLFLREILSISKIYILKKKNHIHEFIRMIEIPFSYIEISNTPNLIQFISISLVETYFPWLLARMCRKHQFLPFIDEYLFGKLKSPSLEIKFMMYWNALEHLANIFWKGTSSKSDPIRKKIDAMCKRIHVNLNEDDMVVINNIYFIRNELFHSTYFLKNIVTKFKTVFNLQYFIINDFNKICKKFELILEKILLKLLNFIPYYFELKISKRFDLFHFLEVKKIKLPSLQKQKQKKEKEIDQRFGKKFENHREWELHHLIESKKELLRYGKYLSVIKFLDKFKVRISKTKRKKYFNGVINTRFGFSKIYLKFIDNKKGKFKLLIPNYGTFLNGILIDGSTFYSTKSYDNSKYSLEFQLFKTNEISPIIPYAKLKEVKGRFITKIIDIKKVVR